MKKCLTFSAVFCILIKQSRKSGARIRGLSSAGRASALQAEGHRFEPCRPHIESGEIAQLARACGSYPQCRGFKSPSRYVESLVETGLFLYDRKVLFLSYKKSRWIALRREGICRLRDPPRRQFSFAGRIPQAGFFVLLLYDRKIFLYDITGRRTKWIRNVGERRW